MVLIDAYQHYLHSDQNFLETMFLSLNFHFFLSEFLDHLLRNSNDDVKVQMLFLESMTFHV